MDRFAARRSLVLDAGTRAYAGRLLGARSRGGFLGAVLTLAVALPLVAWLDDGTGFAASVALTTALIVVSQVAVSLGAAWAMHRAAQQRGGPRVARLKTPTLGDFMPPLHRWWSLATLALSTVAVGIAVVVRPPDPIVGRRELLACWLVGVGLVAATQLAAQVLARAPQPAASPAALAVSDEIRAEQLSVAFLGGLGPAMITVMVTADFLPEAGWPMAAVLYGAPLALEGHRRHHVRRRLWTTGRDDPTGRTAAT